METADVETTELDDCEEPLLDEPFPDDEELDDLDEELDPLETRTTWLICSSTTSMKVIIGPAMTVWFARSRTLLFRGWLSAVIQMATGPDMPDGIEHWSMGCETETGMPPAMIWQNRFCMQGLSKW
jgi:hypothetical protein